MFLPDLKKLKLIRTTDYRPGLSIKEHWQTLGAVSNAIEYRDGGEHGEDISIEGEKRIGFPLTTLNGYRNMPTTSRCNLNSLGKKMVEFGWWATKYRQGNEPLIVIYWPP